MSLFSSLRESAAPPVAVDIAAGRVSAASLGWRGGQPVVAAYAIEPIPEHALVPSLTAQNTVDLKPHVGHTVQVTGTAPAAQDEVSTTTRDKASAASGAAGQQARPTVETTTKADIVAKRLNVSDVKAVSNDCRIAK